MNRSQLKGQQQVHQKVIAVAERWVADRRHQMHFAAVEH